MVVVVALVAEPYNCVWTGSKSLFPCSPTALMSALFVAPLYLVNGTLVFYVCAASFRTISIASPHDSLCAIASTPIAVGESLST